MEIPIVPMEHIREFLIRLPPICCEASKIIEDYENSFEISLYANSLAGYSWSYFVDNEDIISISESYDNSNRHSFIIKTSIQLPVF